MNTTLNQNRSFNLFIVAGIVIALFVAALAIKDVSRRTAIIPNTGGSPFTAQSVPEAGAQGVADYIRLHSDDPSLREYFLGERYGGTPQQYVHEQAMREVQLGERYGVLPDQIALLIAEQKIHREYILGERYGVTPQQSPRSNASLTGDQAASDFYQRHPDWMWAVNDQNTVIPVTGDLAFPDYFMRHPELTAPAEESVDMTDYFFRHLDKNASSLVVSFSAEQIRREYILGEHYGVTPQAHAEQQVLREYWLGEKYGQTP